jgi:molybdate transport system regulatory protein
MEPLAKLYISSTTVKGIFGDGKYYLLKAIQESGSIQEAARKLKRSYRKAWGDIKVAEKGFGQALVVRTRGGKSGGSTILTDFGLQLLKEWKEYRREIESNMKKSFNKHLKKVVVIKEKQKKRIYF